MGKKCCQNKKKKHVLNLYHPSKEQPKFKVDTLEDLIHIGWTYEGDAFDILTLWRLIPAMKELNEMIGMDKLKKSVVDLILYHIQNFGERNDTLHTVLSGPPGIGKTTVAHILAKIYCDLGAIKNNNVIVAKRSDLIGKFIGHSEANTMNILKSAIGGVLFIDEAYSLGASDRIDSFSKAIIDTINQFLSEHSHEFVCIIAGYNKELDENFFAANPGLKRRFPWKFEIEPYSGPELFQIFKKKFNKFDCLCENNSEVSDNNEFPDFEISDIEEEPICERSWLLAVEDDIGNAFFTKNKKEFPYYGGDIETFFSLCKISHTRRIFGQKDGQMIITIDDMNDAFEKFKNHTQSRSHKKEELAHPDMYL